MTQNGFGEQDRTALVEIPLDDDFFDNQVLTPNLPEAPTIFYIEDYAISLGKSKPSYNFVFTLVPYQDQYGLELPSLQKASKIKQWFWAGNVSDGKLYDTAKAWDFKAFLASLNIGNDNGTRTITHEYVKGLLVKGDVFWDKVLSNRENPNTGKVPTEITDDPYTYSMFPKIKQGTLRGVRDTDGSIKKVNI